jgi:ribosomal-protein-alanine N-acetyltransferase
MEFGFKRMSDEEAQAISEWRYDGPYSFYDADQDADDLEELLNPRRRGDSYYSAFDERRELVGFFHFKLEGESVEIGLGLRPELTGKGLGPAFVSAGLEFARRAYAPETFRLAVATFNRRAVRAYEKVGFRPTKTYLHETNGGTYEFLEMVLPTRTNLSQG